MKLKNVIKKAVPESILSTYRNSKSFWGLYSRKIFGIQIYITNRCNSRCQHCNIWQLSPKVDLPAEIISKILNSKCVSSHTHICLEGGEFILHPKIEKILELFAERQVSLITNGILTEKICYIAEKFKISTLLISLDGTPETYKIMRGVDAYNNVIETINCLKDTVEIIIAFTFSPWNSTKDYKHVKELSKKFNVKIGFPNVYTDEPYFMIDNPVTPISERFELEEIENSTERRFLELHDSWLSGKLWLPCFSIFGSVIIYPEGDVFFCHHRKELLGNLNQKTLDEIWYSKCTSRLQKRYINCNGCWCSYHRRHDVALEKFEKMILRLKMIRVR